MKVPRLFKGIPKKKDRIMVDQDPNTEENKTEETGTPPADTQAEKGQDEEKVTKPCSECDGTGLADHRTMGNSAQVLCTNCEGSGQV